MDSRAELIGTLANGVTFMRTITSQLLFKHRVELAFAALAALSLGWEDRISDIAAFREWLLPRVAAWMTCIPLVDS